MENSTRPDRCDRRRTRLTHDRFKFAGIDIEHSLGTFLPESGKTPTLRSPDANARRTQSQRLEHVSASSCASIHEYRNAVFDGSDNFWNTINRCAQGLLVPSTMVGHDDSVGTVRNRRLRILSSHDAFDEQLSANQSTQAIEPLEGQPRRREPFYL
jgi:ribosomal protein L32